MEKKIIHFKGNQITESYGTCNNIQLTPSSEFVEAYWWEIIKDVFSYEKERNAGLQEIHKIFTDDRILKGLELYKKGNVNEGAITDVDVRASVISDDGKDTYTVTMKNWKPDKLLRYRYEMERYISELFFDCSCEDHTINGHYRNNSSLACKHISAVIWKLIKENNFPTIFITPKEKNDDWYEKSKSLDLVKGLYGVSMKQFQQYLNVLILRDFKGIPTSLALSIHKEPNKGYENMYPNKIAPTWLTLTEPGDVEKLIQGIIKGYVEMLASRGNTEDKILESIESLIPSNKDIKIKKLEQENENLYNETLKLYNELNKKESEKKISKEIKSIVENDKENYKDEKVIKKGWWNKIKGWFVK